MSQDQQGGEFAPQPTLEEQIMSKAKYAYVRLGALLNSGFRGSEHMRPESIAVDNALDEFVGAHFDELEADSDVAFTPEVNDAIDAYKNAIILPKFNYAIFKELRKRTEADVTAQLSGKMIGVKLIREHIGVLSNAGLSWDSKLTEVSAPFSSYDAQLAKLKLDREDGAYEIYLWRETIDFKTRTVGDLRPAVELSITNA